MSSSTLRSTDTGQLAGIEGDAGSLAWLGIPYARPPIGELRWRAPQPPSEWAGVRNADAPGSASLQLGMNGAWVGSEDCLYLNVWTPRLSQSEIAKKSRAVMFWIHGGGNVIGQGDRFDGGTLATSQDAVVVTVNYRLGLMGWFRHQALRNPEATPEERSGNFALLDLIAALQWVRRNIAAFGGDPDRVTIFGESAGAANVFALLVSPCATGLFHRAIAQSGLIDAVPPSRAENGTARSFNEIVHRLQINDGLASDQGSSAAAKVTAAEIATYLRSKSCAELVGAAWGIPDTDVSMPFALGVPQMFLDGVVLPEEGFVAAIAKGRYNKVPVILGNTRDEFGILLPMFGMPEFVDARSGGAFRLRDRNLFDRAVEYTSKLWKANHVDDVAAALSQQQPSSTFVYRFDWSELAPAPWWDNVQLGAAHGLDVPFVFGHRRLGPEYIQVPLIQGDALASFESLSAKMRSYWSEFARSGAPKQGGSGDLPPWKHWDAGNVLVFDSPKGGGIRLEQFRVTRESVGREIDSDERLGTPASRQAFKELIARIRGGGLATKY